MTEKEALFARIKYLSQRTAQFKEVEGIGLLNDNAHFVSFLASINAREGTVTMVFSRQKTKGEGNFGGVDSALDNSAPCRFGAGHFGAVS